MKSRLRLRRNRTTSQTEQPTDPAAIPEVSEKTEYDDDNDVKATTDRETLPAREAEDEASEQQGHDMLEEASTKDLELKVGDKTLREHIDPAGASADQRLPEGHKEPFERQIRDKDASWSEGVDRLSDLPTGEKLVETAGDKASRAERVRREAFRQSESAADAVKKNIIIGRGAFERPPTGRPEVRVCSSEPPVLEHIRSAHDGVSIENVVSNLLVLGILASAGVRRRGKASDKKES